MSDTGPEPRDARTPDDAIDPTATDPTAGGAAEDALVARVRADDPAADATPDVAALHAAVSERIAAGGTDELAARRRRRLWVPVAAAAAGALVLGGGGGYAIGASADRSATAGSDTSAVAGTLDGAQAPAAGGAAPGAAPRPQGGRMMGTESSAAADSSYAGWGGGRTVFTAQGLSDQGGSATAWALDAASVYTAERLSAVAAALGVTGDVTDQGGTLTVGPTDGSGASVSMSADGNGSISYYDPAKDPWVCSSEPVAKDVDPCTQRDLGAAPSSADAEAQLRALLAAAGLDADSFAYEGQDQGDPTWLSLTATRLVDGQRTDLQWSASWTGAGLQSVYGSAAPLVSLGDYAVVSPTEAVARLADPRFGSVGGPILYAGAAVRGGVAEDGAAVSGPAQEPGAPTVPATPAPGSPLAWPVERVTIVSATLGLGVQYLSSGAVVLAPTYSLSDATGSTWQVLAVADSALDFSTR